ncbi:hypothetical protein [Nonomuraea salmonea]
MPSTIAPSCWPYHAAAAGSAPVSRHFPVAAKIVLVMAGRPFVVGAFMG